MLFSRLSSGCVLCSSAFFVHTVEIWSLRHSPPLMLLPPTLWVALRGARSAADAATATLEYQYLVYASSFSSLHCCPDHIVYRLSFIIFLLFAWCCLFCIFGGSTGWFSRVFSTSTPKVQRNVNLVDVEKIEA